MAFNVVFYAVVWFITTAFIKDNLRRGYRLCKVLSICAGAVVVLYVGIIELFRYLQHEPFLGFNPSASFIKTLRYALWGVGLLDFLIAMGLQKLVTARISRRNPPTRKLILGLVTASLLIDGEACALGVYGVILFLLGGRSLDLYMFAFVGLCLLWLYFPKYSRWETWATRVDKARAEA